MIEEETMPPPLNDKSLDLIFREARSYPKFQNQPVTEEEMKAIYDVAKWGATSANCCPLRIVFVQGKAAKARLIPLMSPGNEDKVNSAPVAAILAYDTRFYERMPHLFPQGKMHIRLAENPERATETGRFNATLQAAYVILATRALGLDCGPMAGFDGEAVNKEFFPEGRYKTLLICNIGHGEEASLRPRGPRLDFDEACSIL